MPRSDSPARAHKLAQESFRDDERVSRFGDTSTLNLEEKRKNAEETGTSNEQRLATNLPAEPATPAPPIRKPLILLLITVALMTVGIGVALAVGNENFGETDPLSPNDNGEEDINGRPDPALLTEKRRATLIAEFEKNLRVRFEAVLTPDKPELQLEAGPLVIGDHHAEVLWRLPEDAEPAGLSRVFSATQQLLETLELPEKLGQAIDVTFFISDLNKREIQTAQELGFLKLSSAEPRRVTAAGTPLFSSFDARGYYQWVYSPAREGALTRRVQLLVPRTHTECAIDDLQPSVCTTVVFGANENTWLLDVNGAFLRALSASATDNAEKRNEHRQLLRFVNSLLAATWLDGHQGALALELNYVGFELGHSDALRPVFKRWLESVYLPAGVNSGRIAITTEDALRDFSGAPDNLENVEEMFHLLLKSSTTGAE